MVSAAFAFRKQRQMAKEVEWAWRKHDPQQGRIPLAAKERLARIKRQLAPAAAVIEQRLNNDGVPDQLLIDCINKRGIARQRALKLAHAALPGAQLNGSRDRLEVRWLAPRPHLIGDVRSPGERQDNITVHISLLWRVPAGTWSFWASWLLEASDHACGRFLQYTDSDLRAALFEAAAHFAAADIEQAVVNDRSLYLPAGPGVFACDLIRGKLKNEGRVIYARCRTWLANTMLDAKQKPLRPAASPSASVATLLLAGVGDADNADLIRF